MRNQLKWLISWDQKGNAGRSWGLTSSARGQKPGRPTCRCLRSRTPEAETSKPRILASTGESPIFPPLFAVVWIPQQGQDRSGSPEPTGGKPIASDAHGGAGVGSWKKRMPCCNGADTGSEFARRESEQTSRRCLSAEKCPRTILNRERIGKRRFRSTVCAPSPSTMSEPDGSVRVPQSTLDDLKNRPDIDLSVRVGGSRPLRCLSRIPGNSYVRFLEGCGGGNAPVPTRRAQELIMQDSDLDQC
jgi:hypothetical protein